MKKIKSHKLQGNTQVFTNIVPFRFFHKSFMTNALKEAWKRNHVPTMRYKKQWCFGVMGWFREFMGCFEQFQSVQMSPFLYSYNAELIQSLL